MVWLSPPQSHGQLLELQLLLDLLLQGLLLVVIEGQLGGLGLDSFLVPSPLGVSLGLPQVNHLHDHHLLVQHLAAGAIHNNVVELMLLGPSQRGPLVLVTTHQ